MRILLFSKSIAPRRSCLISPPRTPEHAANTSAQYATEVGIPEKRHGFEVRYFFDRERTAYFSIRFLEADDSAR